MLRKLVMVVVGTCLLFGQSLACETQFCWNTAGCGQNTTGFDFNVVATVAGPDQLGLYTYTYTIYRVDNGTRLGCGGSVVYRAISHIAFWFPCGVNAEKSIVNGKSGISMSCAGVDSCVAIGMGGSSGMTEPVMGRSCNTFWGLKFDICACTDGSTFLVPDRDRVSYPTDPDDPYCTITFKSRSGPDTGKWLVVGAATRCGSFDGGGWIYDVGCIPVPSCFAPVDVGETTWGRIKATYR